MNGGGLVCELEHEGEKSGNYILISHKKGNRLKFNTHMGVTHTCFCVFERKELTSWCFAKPVNLPFTQVAEKGTGSHLGKQRQATGSNKTDDIWA